MAKDSAEASAPLPGGAPAKKKGKMGLIIGIVVGLLVLGGGGAAAYWKFVLSAHAADDAETTPAKGDAKKKSSKKGEMPEDPGMLAFEPFLVNLADEGGQTYLRATLNLLVDSEEAAKALEAKPVVLTRLRSAILEVLSTHTAEHLSTPEGKAELKKAIIEKIETLELEVEVHDVLFSDFVVQY
jgi:flagellar protein FliL